MGDHILLSDEHRLWETLEASGLTGKKLACFATTDAPDIAGQLCLAMGVVYESRYELLVRKWIQEAQSLEPLAKRIRGDHTMVLSHMSEEEMRLAVLGKPTGSGLKRESMPEEQWKPRPLKRRQAADAEQARVRQEAEDELRERWAVELAVELTRVDAPAMKELEHCIDASRVPLALAGKTRATTLRRYIKTWAKGSISASSTGSFCEYLFHRFDHREGCGMVREDGDASE